jgi:hypothetical protein
MEQNQGQEMVQQKRVLVTMNDMNKLSLSMVSILFICFLSNCSGAPNGFFEENSNSRSNDTITLRKFSGFISKFKLLSYPFTANTTCYNQDTVLSVSLDTDNDSLFTRYAGPGITVGMLPDTSKFYAVIYCTAAACYIPTLAVYSKNGKLLSKKEISKGCGAGMGYVCSETLTIKSVKDIICSNVEELFNCDSSGKEILGTRKKTIDTSKYSIGENGMITVANTHVVQKVK